jgi:hypothetical protein
MKFCSGLLLIFISLSAFAGKKEKNREFFKLMKLDGPSLTMKDLKKRWNQFQMNNQGQTRYLSLGESHLYRRSHQLFMDHFLNELQAYKHIDIFCTETISSFYNSEVGKKIVENSNEVFISEGNGPSKTNFVPCKKRDQGGSEFLIYSGFFHQIPLAKMFPKTFQSSPISETPGESIISQMYPSKHFMVSFLDLPFLVKTRLHFILNQETKSVSRFRRAAKNLVEKVESLVPKMQIIGDTDRRDRTYYTILNNDHFRKGRFIPENVYFLIKDYGHERNQHVHLLKSLLRWDKSDLAIFIQTLREGRFISQRMHIDIPQKGSQLLQIGYGTVPDRLPYYSNFIELKTLKGNKQLLVFTPDSIYPRCYQGKQEVEFPFCLEQMKQDLAKVPANNL